MFKLLKRFLNISAVTLIGLVAVGLRTPVEAALGNGPNTSMWVTDGDVYTTAKGADGTIYLGGNFHYIGPYKGAGVPVSKTTGTPFTSYPNFGNRINVVVPDGSNGWFVGGSFKTVGTTSRNGIAHILANGTLDTSWNARLNANAEVNSILVTGSTMFVAGDFYEVGTNKLPRKDIVQLTVATAAPTAWDAGDTGCWINSMAIVGSSLVVGGCFTSIGGQARNNLAALDLGTGSVTSLNVSVNAQVYTVMSVGQTLYFGGSFSSVNGVSRSRIASVDMSTGDLTSWNPNANSTVLSLAFHSGSNTVIASGFFTTMGGQPRLMIAGIHASTAAVTAFNPQPITYGFYAIRSLFVEGNTIYAGGRFTNIGGQARNNAAAIDITTSTATSWDPNVGPEVRSLAVSGSNVFIGGDFTSVGGAARNMAAALDPVTGQATSWNPQNGDGTVHAIIATESVVYVAGEFSNMGGQSRVGIAALSKTTGSATAWNPSANNSVLAMALQGNTLYVGGYFSSIGGQGRSRIAALDTTKNTAMATTWAPEADNWINTMVLKGNVLYVGGSFTSIGGVPRNYLASLKTNVATNNATDWDPSADNEVMTIAINGNTVYAGGWFTMIGGEFRNYAAALDISSTATTVLQWDPDAGDVVNALAIDGSTVFVGGEFTTLQGKQRNYLGAVDALTGNPLDWNPDSDWKVFSLFVDSGSLYAGGDFSSFQNGNVFRPYIARFDSADQTSIQFVTPSDSGEEGARTVSIPVTLNAISTLDVSVNYAVTAATAQSGTDYRLSGTKLTIPAGQKTGAISLVLLEDFVHENSEFVTVTLSNPTNATIGNNISFTYTIVDNDTVGIVVSQTAGSTNVVENGISDTFSLSLSSKPASNVTITMQSDNQLSLSGSSAVFTNANWNIPQSITVYAVNDNVIEGKHSGTITFNAQSTDSNYNLLPIQPLIVSITDNDTGGIAVSESGGSTDVFEGGATDSYLVTLSAQPKQDVEIDITPQAEVTVSKSFIVFTPDNWNKAQLIVVTAIDNSATDGLRVSKIVHTSKSEDPNFDSLTLNPVTVNVLDNDGCLQEASIVNGSFENADLAPWVIDGNQTKPVISTKFNHGGKNSVILGTVSGTVEPTGNSSLYTTLDVPANGAVLTYWYRPYSDDTIEYDWMDAYVVDLNGNVMTTIMHVNENSRIWNFKAFDLKAYAGKSIRIKFLVHQDGYGDITGMYLDDVRMYESKNCVDITPTPTPVDTPTPTPTDTPEPSPSTTPVTKPTVTLVPETNPTPVITIVDPDTDEPDSFIPSPVPTTPAVALHTPEVQGVETQATPTPAFRHASLQAIRPTNGEALTDRQYIEFSIVSGNGTVNIKTLVIMVNGKKYTGTDPHVTFEKHQDRMLVKVIDSYPGNGKSLLVVHVEEEDGYAIDMAVDFILMTQSSLLNTKEPFDLPLKDAFDAVQGRVGENVPHAISALLLQFGIMGILIVLGLIGLMTNARYRLSFKLVVIALIAISLIALLNFLYVRTMASGVLFLASIVAMLVIPGIKRITLPTLLSRE